MPEVPVSVNRFDEGHVFTVKVERRWFVGQSMRRPLRAIKIPEPERWIGGLCRETETLSMFLWKRRLEKWKTSK